MNSRKLGADLVAPGQGRWEVDMGPKSPKELGELPLDVPFLSHGSHGTRSQGTRGDRLARGQVGAWYRPLKIAEVAWHSEAATVSAS